MLKATYRLGEYWITEYENDLLLWETHFNFGVQRSGKCFILGDILIIGHWSNEESGYLQLEFFERLNKLPFWNKTRYYCFAFELLDVSTGQSLTNDSLEKSILRINSAGLKPAMNMSPGTFRLGRYQITVTTNGEVLWQMYEGLNRVVDGPCVIESDILFIGPQEYDEDGQGKQEFLNRLHQLPKWDKTITWCRGMVLRECLHQQQVEKPAANIQLRDTLVDHSFDEEPHITFKTRHEEIPKRLSLLVFKWREKTWHRVHGLKGWLKYIIPLVLVGLLLGLVMILHSVEKKSHLPYRDKDHHHEHNDD